MHARERVSVRVLVIPWDTLYKVLYTKKHLFTHIWREASVDLF